MGNLYGRGYRMSQMGRGLGEGILSGINTAMQWKKDKEDAELRKRKVDIEEQRYKVLEKQNETNERERKMRMQQHTIKVVGELADRTPDEQMPAFTEWANEQFKEVGIPPITNLQRTNKNEYRFQSFDDKAWNYNSSKGTMTPITMPGEGGMPGAQLEKPKTAKQQYEEEAANVKRDMMGGGEVAPSVQRAAGIAAEPKPEKPEMTPAKAKHRITELSIAKTKLGTESIVDRILSQSLALPEGKQMTDEDKKSAIAAIDSEIELLKPVAAGGGSGAATSTATRRLTNIRINPATQEKIGYNEVTRKWEPAE